MSLAVAAHKTRWERVARRIRVPLGFATAAVFLLFARPGWKPLFLSLPMVVVGLWLRGYAAGFVKKNAELTVTGPYAYTRNPLYLGSMCLAAGFAVAAGRWWLIVLLVGMFLAIYVPTILSEEKFLRATFLQFNDYANAVPRLLPRMTPARFGAVGGEFSGERYKHHREYNAAIGAAGIYAVLIARMLVFPGR